MFDWIADPNAWIALATLTALEIVLGVDNIIFISILVGRLPPDKRDLARRLGLSLAMGTRILLLLSLAWIMRLTEPLFSVFGKGISGRDLILIGGGLFLLWKSVHEIHNSLEGEGADSEDASAAKAAGASFAGVLVQIAVIDIVFSLDSVITAVGLADDVMVMVVAIVAAVAVMMFAAKPIGDFVDTHPTIKMLALAFLVLVGVTLIGEGFGTHVPKGYIYFAMAFSFAVEMINIRMRKRIGSPVELRKDMPGD
jgi:predicted tellurium resistance membrane protein TerC